MSRRLVYLSFGAVAAVLAVLRTAQAAQAAQGDLAAGATAGTGSGGLGAAVRAFLDEVQVAAAEREQELRTALGLDGTHDLVDADLPGDRL